MHREFRHALNITTKLRKGFCETQAIGSKNSGLCSVTRSRIIRFNYLLLSESQFNLALFTAVCTIHSLLNTHCGHRTATEAQQLFLNYPPQTTLSWVLLLNLGLLTIIHSVHYTGSKAQNLENIHEYMEAVRQLLSNTEGWSMGIIE